MDSDHLNSRDHRRPQRNSCYRLGNRGRTSRPSPVVIGAIALAVYVFSLIAGVALWLERPFGRVGSIVVQAIQLPKYISQLVIFMFSFGFDAYVYGILTNNAQPVFGFELKFLAFHQLFVNVADAPAGFGVSIPACVFLGMLLKFKPKPLAQDASSDGQRTEQSLAADGAIACFSSKLFPSGRVLIARRS